VILAVTLPSVFSFVQAQESSDGGACAGTIYKGKEVSRKAKITSYPPPDMPSDRRAGDVQGKVVLRVVACHTGKITDIKVFSGLPYGLTEAAIKAAKKVRFRPAEKDGQKVSQWIQFEYEFGEHDADRR
jgi:TonB family protein